MASVKTEDDRFFILTLFAVAEELHRKERYGEEVVHVSLAVGLPPAHYGAQNQSFIRYFSGRGIVIAINIVFHLLFYFILILYAWITHFSTKKEKSRAGSISGMTESIARPFGSEVLEYRDKFYTLSNQRIPYKRDKTRMDYAFFNKKRKKQGRQHILLPYPAFCPVRLIPPVPVSLCKTVPAENNGRDGYSGHNLYLAERRRRGKDFYAKLPGLRQLAAGFFPADQIIRLTAHRAARTGAQGFNLRIDAVSGIRLHLPGHYNGHPRKRIS